MKKSLLALCLILAAVLFVGARTEWFDTLIVSGGYGSTGATITAGGAISTNGAVASDSTVTGSQLVSTVTTGTAPLTVASTTAVTNLRAATASNAYQLLGQTWAIPGTIGSGTPNTIAGTTGTFYDGTNGTVYYKRISYASPNVAQAVYVTDGVNKWLVGLRGDLAPGTDDLGFYNSAMSWVPTLLLQHATGNVGIGTTVFDYVAFPWTTAIHCSTVIKGKTSGISDDSPLTLIDSNSQVSAIFANSGRLDLINYGGFGGTMVLQNQTDPAVNGEQTGHYAFSGRNSAGNMNTTGRIFNFISNVTETSMNSEFHFDFMDHQDASGSDYKQPNSGVVLGWQGFDLSDYPITSGGIVCAGGLAASNSAEKVVNGDGSSLTGWTALDGVASLNAGSLRITKSASSFPVARMYQLTALVVGKRYKFTYTYVGNGGGMNHTNVTIGSMPWLDEDYSATYISPGTVTAYFTAVTTTSCISVDVWMVNGGDSGGYTDWDNISLIEMGDGVFAGNVVAGLGLHVGGVSDPGDNNLLVDGNSAAAQFRLSALNTAPANAGDTGTLGEIRIDASYIYVCMATNTWKRAAIGTW